MNVKSSLLDKVAVLLFFVLLTMASLCFGGTRAITSNTVLTGANSEACVLVSFKAKTMENKTYINWQVISGLNNFYFALERSSDGEHFSVVEMRKGFLSPGGQPLLYSFVDESATTGDNIYYRVKVYEIDPGSDNSKIQMLSEKNLLEGNEKALVVIPNTMINELVQNFK